MRCWICSCGPRGSPRQGVRDPPGSFSNSWKSPGTWPCSASRCFFSDKATATLRRSCQKTCLSRRSRRLRAALALSTSIETSTAEAVCKGDSEKKALLRANGCCCLLFVFVFVCVVFFDTRREACTRSGHGGHYSTHNNSLAEKQAERLSLHGWQKATLSDAHKLAPTFTAPSARLCRTPGAS